MIKKVMPKIHQIELTNYCNLKCTYCPITISDRPKGFMTEETFRKTLNYIGKSGQKLLILHNFGEPLLHPQLERFIEIASEKRFLPGFSTNGLLLTEEKLLNLIKAGLRWMCVSIHDKKAIGIFRSLYPLAKENGLILFARSFTDNTFHLGDQVISIKAAKHDFAGTAPDKIKEIHHIQGHLQCDYLKNNYFVVLYDGRITACCMDESGITSQGNIDNMETMTHQKKYDLCENCHGAQFYDIFKWQQSIITFCDITHSRKFFMKLITNKQVQSLFRKFF